MENSELIKLAKDAEKRAYSPYSSVRVGAALLAESGRVYLGANIENSAYSPSICAERVAFSAAVMAGEKKFSKIAVTASRGDRELLPFPPCGVCRQVMAELADGDLEIIYNGEHGGRAQTLSSLLPESFNKKILE